MLATRVLRHASHHSPPGPKREATAPTPIMSSVPKVASRPSDMAEVVGQAALIGQVRTVLRGAKLRGTRPPHVLFDGPPGFGKTSLANVIASELGSSLTTTTGMMLRRPADVVGLLLRLRPNDVLFIDEVHAASKAVLEVLYGALEDGCVPLLLGAGADARAHVRQLPPWTCVAATTAPGALPEPFRARFGFRGTMAPYSVEELSRIVANVWDRQGKVYAADAPVTIGERCKGTPRIALHLAERVLDWCFCQEELGVAEGMAAEALDFFGIDEHGWDAVDHRILVALTETFAGRTVGIEALAQAVGLDRSTLESHEGPLALAGLLSRTARGRMALPAAYDLLRPNEAEVTEEPEYEDWAPSLDEEIPGVTLTPRSMPSKAAQARAMADQHESYLDGLGVGPFQLRAPRKEWDTFAGERRCAADGWDWFYALALDEQERLRRNWMAEADNALAISPDELAEKISITAWLDHTRLIDTLRCLAVGRVAKPSRYGGHTLKLDELFKDQEVAA